MTGASDVGLEQKEGKRVLIAMQGYDEEEETAFRQHPLANYAREVIKYSLGHALSPGLTPEGISGLKQVCAAASE